MDTFDMLPKRIRKVLASANHNWSCEEAFDALLYMEEPDLMKRIQQIDNKRAEEHYALLAAGKRLP